MMKNILVIDRNIAFANFLKKKFPDFNIVFFNCNKLIKNIDFKEVDILFYNDPENNLSIYLDSFNTIEWIFLFVFSKSKFENHDSSLFFLIDTNWTKTIMLDYISNAIKKIESASK